MEISSADSPKEILMNARNQIRSIKSDSLDEIEAVYDSAYEAAKSEKDYGFIMDYAEFLMDRRKLSKGVEITEAFLGSLDDEAAERADVLHKLGRLYNVSLDFEKAEKCYMDEIDLRREAVDGKLADACRGLALVYMNTSAPQKAKPLLKEALDIWQDQMQKNCTPETEYEYAMTCNDMGLLYSESKEYKDAAGCFRTAESILTKLIENDKQPKYESGLASVWNRYALMKKRIGDMGEAEELLNKSLELRRKICDASSTADRKDDLAASCLNLGNFYQESGMMQEATELYLEAQKIYKQLSEKVSSTFSPDLAAVCCSLANCYNDNGEPEKAEKMYNKALKTYRSLVKEVSAEAYEPKEAIVLYNMGAYYAKFDPMKASKCFDKAFKISDKYQYVDPVCKQIFDMLFQFQFTGMMF